MHKIGITILLLAILSVKLSTSQSINWFGNWAFACDFIGNDLSNVNIRGEDCSSRCVNTFGCTHFSWTTFNGGTCWMKKGPVTKADAVVSADDTMVCGLIVRADNQVDPNDPGVDALKGQLLWSDEFGSQQNFENNWNQETGGHGWGNNELQYYTNNNANTEISGGNLTIHTRKEFKDNSRFTSARLISKKSFKYGIFEMKAILPYGRGTWPAFWLLASKRPLNWPQDGEIDIMEHVGYDMNVIHATIHCQTFNHMIGTQISNTVKLTNVEKKFHVYQLYWSKDLIKAYVDNKLFYSVRRPDNSDYNSWPFDNDFQIILNTAVGGNWGGVLGIDESIYPQRYTIDYVRQYSLKN